MFSNTSTLFLLIVLSLLVATQAGKACNASTQFKCLDGSCVMKEKQCNGGFDCFDGSDEKGCQCDNATKFQCKDGYGCFDLSYTCDTEVDCLDASDETMCTCDLTNQFKCANGQCIKRSDFCDGAGVIDCFDQSDELNCSSDCNGDATKFKCRNDQKCINTEWTCDGYQDCLDNSDELRCVNVGEVDFESSSMTSFPKSVIADTRYTRITHDGTLAGWKYNITKSNWPHFQVWRKIEGSTYLLVGESDDHTPSRFNVRKGDLLGFFANDNTMIKTRRCDVDGRSQNFVMTETVDCLEPGQNYTFKTATSCYIFALQAKIEIY